MLKLSGIRKAFGGQDVLKGIDLEVAQGEFVSLLGPSGCGKTTTLNIIAGFQRPDDGELLIGGQRVNDVPTHERRLGMVFQGHALFPHMTCFDNVAFGLRMRKMAEADIRSRVAEALEMVRLSGYEGRFPRELSGGQQQRVGLARALAVRPGILLLDEPLSNLDAKLRRAMQAELRQIHRRVKATMIYVTHDQEEALTLSDRIAVMNAGRIEQLDTPEGIYSRPASRFVADFIGSTSFLEGVVGQGAEGGLLRIDVPGSGNVEVPFAADQWQAGDRVQLGVRADRIRLVQATEPDCLSGTVVDRIFAGANHHVVVELGQRQMLVAHLADTPAAWVQAGSRLGVRVSSSDWMLLS